MKKRILINHKKKKIIIEAVNCNIFKKFSGLMFSRRDKANILLFEFRKPQLIAIHSFFVFYPFLAVWLDSGNHIADMKIIKPFTPCISPKKEFKQLLEIPINQKNKRILAFLITRRKKQKI